MTDASQQKKIKQLRAENKELKRQLILCRQWMQKEIATMSLRIARGRTRQLTRDSLNIDSVESITETIQKYFGDYLLNLAPDEMVQWLINSEVNFYHITRNKDLDGFVVTNSYQKILEWLIEDHVMKGYRPYAKKVKSNLKVNNLSEKTLHKVVKQEFVVSSGKFYGLLQKMRAGENLGSYETSLYDYIQSLWDLSEYLLGDAFMSQMDLIMETKSFGAKRHAGKISHDDTATVRIAMTGNYTSKEGILLKFLEAVSDE